MRVTFTSGLALGSLLAACGPTATTGNSTGGSGTTGAAGTTGVGLRTTGAAGTKVPRVRRVPPALALPVEVAQAAPPPPARRAAAARPRARSPRWRR